MNPSVFTTASHITAAEGHDLGYLIVAAVCLSGALHYLRRMAAVIEPWARIVTAGTMVALSICAALIALAAIAVGGL
jgi:hypothetical protein